MCPLAFSQNFKIKSIDIFNKLSLILFFWYFLKKGHTLYSLYYKPGINKKFSFNVAELFLKSWTLNSIMEADIFNGLGQ